MKKRLFIDMDGVLCDYKKHHAEKLREFPHMPFPQSQYGFFMELEPIANSIATVKALMVHFDVWILTAPSWKNPMCLAEKNYWIQKHFGHDMAQYMITCNDKSLVKGHFLVDDGIHRGQENFEGELLLFGSEKYPDWDFVFEYLMKKI